MKWPIAETVDVGVFIVVRGGSLMAPPPVPAVVAEVAAGLVLLGSTRRAAALGALLVVGLPLAFTRDKRRVKRKM